MADNIEEKKIDIRRSFFRFNTLFAFVAAGVVIYIFLTRFDFNQVLKILSNSNPLFLILAIVVFYGFLPLRGYRWRELLIESNITVPTGELTRIFYQALFVNSILPARIGDIYRAYLLKKIRNVSFSLSIGVLFSERIFDLAAIALLMLAGGLFYLNTISAPEIKTYITLGLLIFGAIVIVFIVISWRAKWLGRFIPTRFSKYYNLFKQGLFKSPG